MKNSKIKWKNVPGSPWLEWVSLNGGWLHIERERKSNRWWIAYPRMGWFIELTCRHRRVLLHLLQQEVKS